MIHFYAFVKDNRRVGIAFPLCDSCAETQKIPEGLALQKIFAARYSKCDNCNPAWTNGGARYARQ